MVVGDLNFHDGDLSAKNCEMVTATDRAIKLLLTSVSPSGMGLFMRGPFDTATHVSGSTIDVVLSSVSLDPSIQLLDRLSLSPKSDHCALLIDNVTLVQSNRIPRR